MNVREQITEAGELIGMLPTGTTRDILNNFRDISRQLQQQIDDMKKTDPIQAGRLTAIKSGKCEACGSAIMTIRNGLEVCTNTNCPGDPRTAPPPPLPVEQQVKGNIDSIIGEAVENGHHTPLKWWVELFKNCPEEVMLWIKRNYQPSPSVTGMTTEEPKCTCAGDVVSASDSRNKGCPLHGTVRHVPPLPTIETPEAIVERLIKQINSSRRFEFPGPSKTIVLYAGELATQSSLQIILDGLRENLSAAISLHRSQIESAARAKAIEECKAWLVSVGWPSDGLLAALNNPHSSTVNR